MVAILFWSDGFKMQAIATNDPSSGAVEAAVTVLTVHKQSIPPTINLNDPDVGCDLDYVKSTRPYPVKTALCVNAGFGGRYSCLVFGQNEGAA